MQGSGPFEIGAGWGVGCREEGEYISSVDMDWGKRKGGGEGKGLG